MLEKSATYPLRSDKYYRIILMQQNDIYGDIIAKPNKKKVFFYVVLSKHKRCLTP